MVLDKIHQHGVFMGPSVLQLNTVLYKLIQVVGEDGVVPKGLGHLNLVQDNKGLAEASDLSVVYGVGPAMLTVFYDLQKDFGLNLQVGWFLYHSRELFHVPM